MGKFVARLWDWGALVGIGLSLQLPAVSAWAGGGGGGGGKREASVPWVSPTVWLALNGLVIGYIVFRQVQLARAVPVRIKRRPLRG